MWSFSLVSLGLIAVVSANWKPIVGPSSSSFNKKIPFGESHTYYGNEFLSEYAGFGDDHLIVPSLAGHQSTTLLGGESLGKSVEISDKCRPQKYALEYEGTLQIDQTLPHLDQFTLCNWMRFTNHSGDHTIFTYSINGKDREIQSWIANTPEASFISMAVHGQSLYRLNYPFRYGRWHHQCTSWNGKTGEWQLWIRGERIGRGFHNRLVHHSIKSGGSLVIGGPSITGPTADGLHMEVTMFQMYKVALSAGKAHRDHKHHHVHKFVHNGPAPETSSVAPPPTAAPLPPNPLLANGQIPNRVRLNLAGVQQQPQPAAPVAGLPVQLAGNALQQPVTSTQFVNGQFHGGSRLVAQQLFPSASPKPAASVAFFPSAVEVPAGGSIFGSHSIFKREDKSKPKAASDEKTKTKRELVQLSNGQTIDDSLLGNAAELEQGLAFFGGAEFKQQFLAPQGQGEPSEDEIKEYDREPAEGEVMAIMNLCSFCDHEPFLGALILAWKNVKITMHHALQAKAQGTCGQF